MKTNIEIRIVSFLILLLMIGPLSACQKQSKDNKPLLYVSYGNRNSVDADQVYFGGGRNPESAILTFGYATDHDEEAAVLTTGQTFVIEIPEWNLQKEKNSPSNSTELQLSRSSMQLTEMRAVLWRILEVVLLKYVY